MLTTLSTKPISNIDGNHTSLRFSHWSAIYYRLLSSEFLYNTTPTATTSSHAERAQMVRTTAERKGFQLQHDIDFSLPPSHDLLLLLLLLFIEAICSLLRPLLESYSYPSFSSSPTARRPDLLVANPYFHILILALNPISPTIGVHWPLIRWARSRRRQRSGTFSAKRARFRTFKTNLGNQS